MLAKRMYQKKHLKERHFEFEMFFVPYTDLLARDSWKSFFAFHKLMDLFVFDKASVFDRCFLFVKIQLAYRKFRK